MYLIKTKYHSLQWFLDRIGKRIYRYPLSCHCKFCKRNYVNIGDCRHARYLYDCQNEMEVEYFDKPPKSKFVRFIKAVIKHHKNYPQTEDLY